MPYIMVGEERIFYTYHRGADPQSPAMLLVHGAGGNHQYWGFAIRHLKEAAVYALDLPGHGRSNGSGRANIADYADFLARFMDALGLVKAIVAGHSMGGAIAMTMALRHPDRVAGLVLVGTGARLRVLPAILEGTLHDFERTIAMICEYAYSPNAPEELVHQGQRQMLRVAPQVIHGDFAACNAFDVMERLGEIHCPTLIICGSEDKLTPPKYAAFLAEHIAGAELTLIEGAGHMVMMEKPDLVASAIASALARWRKR
ncbi:MAG: alpha/beta fold hydrolase [Chloroflexi bacterium]|nr:alpha/beta fold hydrolase [Chloroflexota bacterium]